jgi:hypothetical protein
MQCYVLCTLIKKASPNSVLDEHMTQNTQLCLVKQNTDIAAHAITTIAVNGREFVGNYYIDPQHTSSVIESYQRRTICNR